MKRLATRLVSLAVFMLLTASAAPAAEGRSPLRPGEVPADLSRRADSFFEQVRQRQWGNAAAMVSQRSRTLFAIEQDALPEVVLTHITFNPGRILQLELTGKSWFHLSPHHPPAGNRVDGLYQMEILLLDDDYYPELTLLWALEDGEWRLFCDDIYHHYRSLEIPGDPRGLCTKFMRLLRHGHWAEAAAMVSERTRDLPFTVPRAGPRELVQSLTHVPGKDTFKQFVLTFDGASWCEIGQYNPEQGWFEMRLHRMTGGTGRLSLLWVREAGAWRVFCDADYLRYLDLKPPERMPPGLLEAVERYHTNYCRGFNRQWWESLSDNALWKAYEMGSEKLQARVSYEEFATFPDPLPVPRFNIRYRGVVGFAHRSGDIVEVVVTLRGGAAGARLSAPATSQWIEIEGRWRRTTPEAEAAN